MNRKLLIGLLGVMLCFYGLAFAQELKYPTKPIKMVVGYAPGGGSDIMGRLIAPHITKATGQPIIVENKPGAAQNVAAEIVARAPKDGYTLFMSSASLSVNVSLYAKLNYDPVKDFAPVALFGMAPNVLLIHPSFPAANLKEFIAVVKKNPGKYNYSTSGIGSTQHLTGELLKLTLNSDIVHVPYKGTGPSMTALAGGEVNFSLGNVASALPMLTAGKIKAIGITSAKRSPLLPDVPTMIEGGLPDFVTGTWFGLLAPAGTPSSVVNSLNAVIVKIVKTDEFRQQLAQIGMDPVAEPPEHFQKFLLEEINRWSKVVKAAKIKVE